ncbi:MAG: methyltransferase domain-containing protein [Acidobacteriota bacterium]|nr:methyltransferase domain-containing protein [Acidobacteriota bacterium]
MSGKPDTSIQTIQKDFDRIALLSNGVWDHSGDYTDFLLREVPANCSEALDIGCGSGSFTRLLAQRCKKVRAIDLSPEMIRIARARSEPLPNIDFEVADVMTLPLPARHFDCIVSIATLHHLPLGEMVARMKAALKTNGVLLVLDLFARDGAMDAIRNTLAMPVSVGKRFLRTGRLKPPRALRQAWDDHGRHDSYATLTEVREICAGVLPGARIRKHLLWRYSIVWKKTD